MSIKRDFTLFL